MKFYKYIPALIFSLGIASESFAAAEEGSAGGKRTRSVTRSSMETEQGISAATHGAASSVSAETKRSKQYAHVLELYKEGGTQNLAYVRKYFKKAADQGDEQSQYNYANMCRKGEGGPEDLPDAKENYKLAADQGHKEAQYQYAEICFFRDCGPRNLTDARKYYQKAADQGHKEAQYNCAVMCLRGEGGPEDLPDARKYLKLAAEKRQDAQFWYAVMCRKGEGGPQNLDEAIKYFKKGVDQGSPLSQFNYAMMCHRGEGEPQNLERARYYLQAAADQGYLEARHEYALMLLHGEGGPQNLDEAIKYFKKGMDQGFQLSIKQLEYIYRNGSMGLVINLERAEYYKAKLRSITVVDVHEESEKSILKTRITRFYQVPGFDESAGNVDALKAAFFAFLESYTDEAVKRKATLTLLDGGETAPGSFGPLLGNPVTYEGLETTGDIFLARMWWWITTQYEEGDRTEGERHSAKLSLVRSLADSITESSLGTTRMCNQGKIARVFEAVLSGRLEGCAIVTTRRAITTAAVNLFFDQHTTIEGESIEAEALRTEAEAVIFMNANPGIDRYNFIRNIYYYIIQDILGNYDLDLDSDNADSDMPNWRDCIPEEEEAASTGAAAAAASAAGAASGE